MQIVVRLAFGFLSPLLATAPSAQLPSAQNGILYVNAETGEDSNGGKIPSDPLLTLNEALRRAYSSPVIEIRIQRSSVPIAPDTHGGAEHFGWRKNGEPFREPFPIRIPSGISIRGIPNGGQLPVIAINEVAVQTSFTDWEPFVWSGYGLNEPLTGQPYEAEASHAYLVVEPGADNVTISSLRFDGQFHSRSKSTALPTAIWAINTTDLMVVDCQFTELHDGVFFYASDDDGTGLPGNLSATVIGGQFDGFYPHDAIPGLGVDRGHAGAWLVGEGYLDVTFEGNVVFHSNHDGIEIAGTNRSGVSTSVDLAVDRAQFLMNDNGLEVVGAGLAKVDVQMAQFVQNYTINPGANEDGQGILARGMSAQMDVRSSLFENNAYGVYMNLGAPAYLNLGCFDQVDNMPLPGNNLFAELDPDLADAKDRYRVHLYSLGAAPVYALGNTWIPLNQGADAAGQYSSGIFTGPDLNVPPPGPGGVDGMRNFSILSQGGTVFFDPLPCPQ